VRPIALLLLAAGPALAGSNDLQLWRLGHPDPLGCTACDGRPADPAEPGDANAQARFHRFASTLGLAFVPPFQETAGTVGQSGFEVGFSSSEAFPRVPADSWATAGGAPPSVLVLPALAIRKGLGGSLEIGAAVSWLADSQLTALSLELRWAPLDGIANAPDVALRAWGTRVVGTQELDLAMAGADLLISRSFGVAGMMKLQPYGSFGIALINALTSVVDFRPGVENQTRPGLDDGTFHTVSMIDNRYLRGTAGLRLVAGVVVLGVEGSLAGGSTPIQHDNLSGGGAPPSQYVRLWSLSGRLGFGF